ncbi:hypothetical protein HDV62DRAFT_211550 [Trichoderma sp. SZMC 28011]
MTVAPCRGCTAILTGRGLFLFSFFSCYGLFFIWGFRQFVFCHFFFAPCLGIYAVLYINLRFPKEKDLRAHQQALPTVRSSTTTQGWLKGETQPEANNTTLRTFFYPSHFPSLAALALRRKYICFTVMPSKLLQYQFTKYSPKSARLKPSGAGLIVFRVHGLDPSEPLLSPSLGRITALVA